MTPEDKVRNSFILFAKNCFSEFTFESFQIFLLQKIEEELLKPERGKVGLLLSIAPGLGKTMLSNILIAWLLGHNPTNNIIICSYSAKISNIMGKRTRKIMELPFYKKIFPGSAISSDGTSGSFELAAGGDVYCTATGASITSRRADWIIADDLVKNMSDALSEKITSGIPEFLFSTLLSRHYRGKPKVGYFHIETKWSQKSPITLIAKAYPEWNYYNIPALCEEQDVENDIFGRQLGASISENLLPAKELIHLKSVNPLTFDNLYQGRDVNYQATYFKSANLKASYDIPALSKLERPVTLISLDTASQTTESADFTVATHWAAYKDYWIVTKIDKLKVDITGLLNYVDQQKADYLICEQASSGLQLLQLRQEVLPSKVFKNMEDKESYAKAFNELLGAKIFIKQAEVTLDVENEILSFPFGKHDDSVLSLLHGYRFLLTNQLTLKNKTKNSRTAAGLMRRANSW